MHEGWHNFTSRKNAMERHHMCVMQSKPELSLANARPVATNVSDVFFF